MQTQPKVILNTAVTAFKNKLSLPLTKKGITVLQINLGKRCNLSCTHCHVEPRFLTSEKKTLGLVKF